MGKEGFTPQQLQETYDANLKYVRARMNGEPAKIIDDELPALRFSFTLTCSPRADLRIPEDIFPNLNGGRTERDDLAISELITDLEARQSLHHHLRTKQDPRHVMAIEFFVANWEVLSALLHPHATDFVEPRAFTEIDIGKICGPVDFVGIARDGTMFVAEFGKGSSKHGQLRRYLPILEELYPAHAQHMQPFVVTPLHKDPYRNMILRASALREASTVFPANGDQPLQ